VINENVDGPWAKRFRHSGTMRGIGLGCVLAHHFEIPGLVDRTMPK
jgi:hypothetical protein